MQQLSLIVIALMSGSPSNEPPNEQPPQFGAQGTWVPNGSLSLTHLTTTLSGFGRISQLHVSVLPTLDYFVLDRVSIGMGLGGHAYTTNGFRGVGISASLRAGYHVALSETVGLYPQVGLAYSWSRNVTDLPGPGSFVTHGTALDFTVYTPLLYHVGHFFLGAGPHFYRTLMQRTHLPRGLTINGAPTEVVGLTTTLGGWL